MSGGYSRRAWAVLGLAVATLVITKNLPAQTAPTADADTIYFGQPGQEEIPKFYIAPLRGYLDLRATYTDSKTSRKGGGGTDSHVTEMLFQESLTLYSHGYIVHPNLVDFRFSITGGLSQEQLDSDVGSANTNGTVYGWDVSAIFFRNQPGNLTLYSRRTEGIVDVPFGPTLKTTTMQTGALWNYRTAESSLQLEAYHLEDTQSSFGEEGNDFSETRDVVRGEGESRLTQNQVLNWNFDLESAKFDSGTDSTDEQFAALSLGHVATFGEGGRSALSSSASYSQARGTLDREDLRWNEHLHLYHTPEFETNYDYSYQKLTYGNNTTDRRAAYVDARHQLYDSLSTFGRLRWEDVTAGGNSTRTYSGDLGTNYRKDVPYGVFTADAEVGRQIQQIDGSGVNFVADQPVAFTIVDPVTVAQPNAIPASVIVRDAVSGRTFVEGLDYTVTQTPVGLEVNRVIGGNILPAQPLLLSYDFTPLDANEVITDSYGIGSRYQFTKGPLAGLSPFARFFGQDQSISGGTARPNSIRDYILGVDYQYDGLTLRAEREILDSTLFPYKAWRYEARYNYRLSSETALSTGATYSDIQYQEPEQHTRNYTLNATMTHQFTTELNASIYAAYVNAESSLGGTTVGIEEGAELSWIHRETKVYMRVRNTSLDSDVTQRTFQYVQLGLTRQF